MKVSAKDGYFELFNGLYKEHGGHSQWASESTGLDYLRLDFMDKWQFGYMTIYYDGFHHFISLGLLGITWGGKPFNARSDFADEHKGFMFNVCRLLEKYWPLL